MENGYENSKCFTVILHNLQTLESLSHSFTFRLNSDRVLEFFIPFGNVDHKGNLRIEYCLFRMILSLPLAVANGFHFSCCTEYLSQGKDPS